MLSNWRLRLAGSRDSLQRQEFERSIRDLENSLRKIESEIATLRAKAPPKADTRSFDEAIRRDEAALAQLRRDWAAALADSMIRKPIPDDSPPVSPPDRPRPPREERPYIPSAPSDPTPPAPVTVGQQPPPAKPSDAGYITTLYFRNLRDQPMLIWVNDAIQGYVPAKTTCYMLQEGLVTSDSGWQPDGTLKIRKSRGGWPHSNPLTIIARTKTFVGYEPRPWYSQAWMEMSRGAGDVLVTITDDSMISSEMTIRRDGLTLLRPHAGVPVVDNETGIAGTELAGLLAGFPLNPTGASKLDPIDQALWANLERKAREYSQLGNGTVGRSEVRGLLSEVRTFLTEQPGYMPGWVLQARLALSLGSVPEGFSAAYNLERLGAWKQSPAGLAETLKALEERGWRLQTSPP